MRERNVSKREEVLADEVRNLIDAGRLVLERWEHGDLADAVRSLQVDLEHAEGIVADSGQPARSTPIPETEPIRFRNHYRCPNDGTEWTDEWSCQCNDRCPTCNAEIEPYESEDL